MKRKFSIAIICTSIVVILISAYSYYTIDFTQETEPSSKFDERGTPKRGAIIYQANAILSRNQDGSWSVDSKEQTRLNVWTEGSGDFR